MVYTKNKKVCSKKEKEISIPINADSYYISTGRSQGENGCVD
jgi:uncharacterized membrane-anchored protein